MKTHAVKAAEIDRNWILVDASDQVLGRLATQVATYLKGKHKPIYTTHLDTGDYVVVVNAEKVRVTGQKEDQKVYKHHSMHPGGLKVVPIKLVREKFPTRIIERAVKGMLPHGALGDTMLRKLKVYAGPDHPHGPQQPVPYEEV